jgi:hypothetical protein
MPTKNLVATSLLVAVCASPLVAQSATKTPEFNVATPSPSSATQNGVSHIPALKYTQITNTQITVFDPDHIPAGVDPKDVTIAMAGLETMKSKVLVLPQNKDSLCFAIRSSEFTEEDLKSNAPHASSHSTCVPAASSRMKSAVMVQAK